MNYWAAQPATDHFFNLVYFSDRFRLTRIDFFREFDKIERRNLFYA